MAKKAAEEELEQQALSLQTTYKLVVVVEFLPYDWCPHP
jgi:hypothetical protein